MGRRFASALVLVSAGGLWGLTLLTGPNVSGPPRHGCQSPPQAARMHAMHLAAAVELYIQDRGRDPAGLDVLLAPWQPGGEPYMEDIPTDPWGRPFALELGDGPRRVRSFGPDGAPGGDDDVEAPIHARPRVQAAHRAPPVPATAPERRPAPAAGVR